VAPSLSLTTFSKIIDELSSDLRGRSNVEIGGGFNAWAEEWGSLIPTPEDAPSFKLLRRWASSF